MASAIFSKKRRDEEVQAKFQAKLLGKKFVSVVTQTVKSDPNLQITMKTPSDSIMKELKDLSKMVTSLETRLHQDQVVDHQVNQVVPNSINSDDFDLDVIILD